MNALAVERLSREMVCQFAALMRTASQVPCSTSRSDRLALLSQLVRGCDELTDMLDELLDEPGDTHDDPLRGTPCRSAEHQWLFQQDPAPALVAPQALPAAPAVAGEGMP